MPTRSHSRRAAGLALLSGVAVQTVSFAAGAPDVRVNTVQVSNAAPAPGTAVTATIVGQNMGTVQSPHNPLTVLWCGYVDSIYKDKAGKWTVTPALDDCSPATSSLVRFSPLAPAATEQLSVAVTAPSDFCQKALVVKYRDGKNDFTDPAIAKYTPVHVTGLKPLGETTLASSVSVTVVKAKKKPTKERVISVSYDIAGSADGKSKIGVQLCRGNRCWLKHAESVPAANVKTWKEKVGTKWEWKTSAKGSFEVKHLMESSDFYPGLPSEIRVSYGPEPRTHQIVERKCDDSKLVSYVPLK